MDSRPFQIFEGSNEMLYAQIAEMVTRQMKKQKLSNVFDFLKDFKRTADACLYFKNDLNFNIDNNIPQRKLVDLGKIISRIICAGYVIDLANKGFRADLADNCITSVRQEVAALVCSFKFSNTVNIIEDYTGNSSWMEFV